MSSYDLASAYVAILFVATIFGAPQWEILKYTVNAVYIDLCMYKALLMNGKACLLLLLLYYRKVLIALQKH